MGGWVGVCVCVHVCFGEWVRVSETERELDRARHATASNMHKEAQRHRDTGGSCVAMTSASFQSMQDDCERRMGVRHHVYTNTYVYMVSCTYAAESYLQGGCWRHPHDYIAIVFDHFNGRVRVTLGRLLLFPLRWRVPDRFMNGGSV